MCVLAGWCISSLIKILLHYQDTRTRDRPFLMLRTRCVQERNLCVISHRGRHGAGGQHKSFHNRRLKIDRTFTQHQQWMFCTTNLCSDPTSKPSKTLQSTQHPPSERQGSVLLIDGRGHTIHTHTHTYIYIYIHVKARNKSKKYK